MRFSLNEFMCLLYLWLALGVVVFGMEKKRKKPATVLFSDVNLYQVSIDHLAFDYEQAFKTGTRSP